MKRLAILTFILLLILANSILAYELKFYFFFSPECNECYKVKHYLFPQLEAEYNVKLNHKDFDILDEKNFELLLKVRDYFKNDEDTVPIIVINNHYIAGFDKVYKKFPVIVEKYVKEKKSTKFLDLSNLDNKTQKISISILPVLYAGLMDGVNPCAFATIIFLISYLSYLKKTKKIILITGIFYTTAVFITYLLIGMGFFESIIKFKYFYKIALIVNIAIALFSFTLAFFSLKDYFLAKKGNYKDMVLQLPDKFKLKIHKNIKEKTRGSSIIISSIILGIMVSLFELACTGQIYLPTIIYLTKTESFKGFIYLILYNIMFIIPLVIIFILFYSGVSSKKIADIFQKNVPLIKLLTFILFLLLGLFILLHII